MGYVELWFTAGATRFLARFHNFTTNDATQLVTLKASKLAAAGETAFWEVLLGDDESDERQLESLDLLGKATGKNAKDGRSPFLCGMMHMYRYGHFLTPTGQPTAPARAEIGAATDAFQVAEPRLWDGTHGDSRVPGFVAAARFTQGFANARQDLMNEGIADLQDAIAVNAFFNVFDLIPVLQALPTSDPRWQQAYGDVVTYLEDPARSRRRHAADLLTTASPCAIRCSLVLFGDVYAKAGNARSRRASVRAVQGDQAHPTRHGRSGPRDRRARRRCAHRRYQDADPDDDPAVSIGDETCAVCHRR